MTYSCSDIEDLAPELALGILPGDQRALVLAHLETCASCARVVKELSETADALVLAAPEVQPPAGFARRVTRSLRPARAGYWRPVAVAAALALVVGLAGGVVTGRLGTRGTSLVRVASFAANGPEPVDGQVYTRADRPSWVFMTVSLRPPVSAAAASERYTCELVLADGRQVAIGSFQMHDGAGSWGHTIDVKVSDVRAVALLNDQGQVAATAALRAG